MCTKKVATNVAPQFLATTIRGLKIFSTSSSSKLYHFLRLQVTKEDEFVELTNGQLISLVKKDELNVPDEEDVFNAVLRWVEHSPAKRKDWFYNILKVMSKLPIFHLAHY